MTVVLILLMFLAVPGAGAECQEGGQDARTGARAPDLRPTEHPSLPATLADYWLLPAASWQPTSSSTVRKAIADLGLAFARIKEERYAAALPLIQESVLAQTPLGGWATCARGRVELGAGRYEQARRTFAGLRARNPVGAVAEAASLGEAAALEGLGDFKAAASAYAALIERKVGDPADVLASLARVANAAGDRARAAAAWERLYFEYPATDQGKEAARVLAKTARPPLTVGSARAARELERAEELFGRRQYTDARAAFESLAHVLKGDAGELVRLRVAECDYHLRRYRQSVSGLRPLLTSATRGAEAAYYHLSAVRGTGQHVEYVRLARRLVTTHTSSPWAERTLDGLGSHYIIVDEDAKAAEVFLELVTRYPSSDFAQRASWKVGWWAYRQERFADAAGLFERAADSFPRSDYRPAFLYWSGKARERLGQRETAAARYRLSVADYGNLYYGRLAVRRLEALGVAPRAQKAVGRFAGQPASTPSRLAAPDAERLGWLVRAGMFEQAIAELNDVKRREGSTRALETTRAWLFSQAGDRRTGISLMRRLYPHFMADGGEGLPDEILKVIYPLDYWPLITKYAAIHGLDPYLIAALMAQESAFDPAARSAANAIGLMQLLPRTARLWARKLGLRYSASLLTTPEFSVRVGTAYFAELMKRFDGVHFALAGYNAGENRVSAWKAERPGMSVDEFIDDIPFPETQTYVKRILGIADDYRRLYAKQ